jgi:hypothetical protein
MATSGRGTGVVGYNVQAAVETTHHLIVTHEVTNEGHDRTQLAAMAGRAREAMLKETLTVIADRGYFSGEEIVACEAAGITPLVPATLTSGAKAAGRFGKWDFVYLPESDAYRCPAGETLKWRFNRVDATGKALRYYWTTECAGCPIKARCTPAPWRRVARWEHEGVLDAMQRRLDQRPDAMRVRRRTVEHAFGTIKAWMRATHFLTKTLKRVQTEMSLQVLAYNLKRAVVLRGVGAVISAARA